MAPKVATKRPRPHTVGTMTTAPTVRDVVTTVSSAIDEPALPHGDYRFNGTGDLAADAVERAAKHAFEAAARRGRPARLDQLQTNENKPEQTKSAKRDAWSIGSMIACELLVVCLVLSTPRCERPLDRRNLLYRHQRCSRPGRAA
jgi:hypothetical protein